MQELNSGSSAGGPEGSISASFVGRLALAIFIQDLELALERIELSVRLSGEFMSGTRDLENLRAGVKQQLSKSFGASLLSTWAAMDTDAPKMVGLTLVLLEYWRDMLLDAEFLLGHLVSLHPETRTAALEAVAGGNVIEGHGLDDLVSMHRAAHRSIQSYIAGPSCQQ
jgi:hypothetical protein